MSRKAIEKPWILLLFRFCVVDSESLAITLSLSLSHSLKLNSIYLYSRCEHVPSQLGVQIAVISSNISKNRFLMLPRPELNNNCQFIVSVLQFCKRSYLSSWHLRSNMSNISTSIYSSRLNYWRSNAENNGACLYFFINSSRSSREE